MSVERYFKEVIKPYENSSNNQYGTQCKLLVQTLLEADGSIFTLAQVDYDTPTNYNVWLRVYETDFYMRVYHNSGNCYMAYHRNLGTDALITEVVSNFFGGKSGESYRATVSRFGDFAFSFMLGSSITTTGLVGLFSMFTSDYDGQTYYRYNLNDNSVGLTSYGNLPSPFGSANTIRASDGSRVPCTEMTFNQNSATLTKATKTPYVLMPVATVFYYDSTPIWLGHVKWGGKYDIYVLQSAHGNHTVEPNANYIVDGVSYKGTFRYLFIPVECS